MQLLAEAERLLMDELPILPIYFYVSRNLVKPYVRGFYNNIQDYHPRVGPLDRSRGSNRPIRSCRGGHDRFCLAAAALVGDYAVGRLYRSRSFLMRAVPGGPFDRERPLAPEIRRNFERQVPARSTLPRAVLEPAQRRPPRRPGALHADWRLLGPRDHRHGLADLGVTRASWLSPLLCWRDCSSASLSAVMRGTAVDVTLRLAATIGIALPSFVIAGICIMLFVFLIPLFPAAGWGRPSQLVLPAFCLGAPYAAYVARISRTSMLDVLGQDHIRTARAKGVGPLRVVLVHALRGALLPVASFLGPAVAGILTGSLVVEQIFAIPGMGVYFVKAAFLRDWTLSMGVVLLYTLLLYTMNFLVDLSYAWLDPRVELE